MKRSLKSKKIGDLIHDFIEDNNAKKPTSFAALWKKIVGDRISNETSNVRFKNNTLYVYIKNPYLKSDILSQKDVILKKIKLLNSNINYLVFD